MNLFNYLMAKKGHNTSVRDDLFAYLLGKKTPKEVKTATGTTISITDATREKIVSLTLSKESTQDGTPTPDNSVEVNTVKGYRNLFDKNAILEGYSLNRNTNRLEQNTPYRTSDYCEVKPNTTYYLGMYFSSSNYGILYYDENKTWLSSIAPAIKFTTPANTKYVRFSWVRGNWDLDAIQLTESEEKLPYVPYGTNWIYTAISNGTDTNYYTIPLNDNEIAGIGTYKDELIVDKNGKCWLNKKIGKIVLDGSENYVLSSSQPSNGIKFYYSHIYNGFYDTMKRNDVSLCNYFNIIISEEYISATATGLNFVPFAGINFCILNSDITINQFKSLLNNNNLILYSLLSTEDLIDLNYTVDLTLFNGVNNISNSEDMDMTLKYY